MPCDVMFVGEAPGKTEDLLGKPFVGPSGQLLEELIDEATEHHHQFFEYGITNIVACIPWKYDEDGEKDGVRPPTAEEADPCSVRLHMTIEEASPQGIVLLGKTATQYGLQKKYEGQGLKVLALPHPAYLLRSGGRMSKHYTPFVVHLRDFLQEVL